jgi:REP element-mobilizing transposase RayT
MIRLFKSATTKRINEYRNTPAVPVWQRNYYEHIIRNEIEWKRIRQYIINNPIHWKNDKNYS